jgi:hypothetical protein
MRTLWIVGAIAAGLALAGCQSSSGPASTPASDSTAKPAGGGSLAGKWELDIVADSHPHLTLDVADDLSAKLVGSAGFNNRQYASITFVKTKTGINVVVDEIQNCGNRTVTYTTVKAADGYTGSVSGPNADCKAGRFQSPPGTVKLVRQEQPPRAQSL